MILPFEVHPSEEVLAQYGIDIDTSYYPLLQLRCAVIGCILYLISDLLFQPPGISKDGKSVERNNGSSWGLKLCMFVHNSALCIFSVLCFLNTFPVAWELFNHPQGWLYACREGWHDKFVNSEFGYWAYLFYLSKYYEFVDTWIVIARGRRPIFLQVFHHIGAVFGMWMGMVLHSTGAWIFMILNSFIHSIMYFYYATSVIKLPLPKFFKKLITKMQMIQFIIGNSCAILQIYIYSNVIPLADKVCIMYHVVYTSILFLLFNAFYQKTYNKKGKQKNH